jgi:hypothetical protein
MPSSRSTVVAAGRNIEFDLVAVQRGLHRRPDALLFPPNAEVTFSRGTQHEHPELFGFGRGEVPQHSGHGYLGADDPRLQLGAFYGCSPVSALLLALAATFGRVCLRLLSLGKLDLQGRLFLRVPGCPCLPATGLLARGLGFLLSALGLAELAAAG